MVVTSMVVTSQRSRSSCGGWLKMREAVAVAWRFGFWDMGCHSSRLVRAQHSVVVKVAVIVSVGVEMTVIVGVFVDGSTVRISGCRHGRAGDGSVTRWADGVVTGVVAGVVAVVGLFLGDRSSGTDGAQLSIVCGFWLACPRPSLVFAVVVRWAGSVSLFLLVVLTEEELEDCGNEEKNARK